MKEIKMYEDIDNMKRKDLQEMKDRLKEIKR